MHTATNTRLAVFDLDGTLVDSRRDLATAANLLLRELGGAGLSEEAVGSMVGEGAGVLVRRVLTASGLAPETPGALPRFLELYGQHLLDTTAIYEGVDRLLKGLRERMPLAVLTNKPQGATDRILSALGLTANFRTVIGGDTTAGRKPDPAGLLSIVRDAGVTPAETILVGDSPIDVETARRAGTRICVAAWGFGFRGGERRDGELLAAAPADVANLF